MIVVEPNGVTRAWPVYGAPDLWEPIGNVLTEPISAVWARYRFKENHYAKYLGRSIRTTTRTGAESEAWPVLPTALGSARQRPSGHPLADRPGSLPAPSRAVRKQT